MREAAKLGAKSDVPVGMGAGFGAALGGTGIEAGRDGIEESAQAAVGAIAGDGTPPTSAGAGTVSSSPQAGHLARAEARSSDVVNSLPQCGQLNSIATLRPRSSLLP